MCVGSDTLVSHTFDGCAVVPVEANTHLYRCICVDGYTSKLTQEYNVHLYRSILQPGIVQGHTGILIRV